MKKPATATRARAPVTNEDIYLGIGTLTEAVRNFKEKVESVEEGAVEIRKDLSDLRAAVAEQVAMQSAANLQLTIAIERLSQSTTEGIQSINTHLKTEVDPVIDQVKAWRQRGIGVLATVGMVSSSLGVLLAVYWEPARHAARRLLGIE